MQQTNIIFYCNWTRTQNHLVLKQRLNHLENIQSNENVFSDLPVKNAEEAYEKNIEISKNNDYATGNLLNFAYFK